MGPCAGGETPEPNDIFCREEVLNLIFSSTFSSFSSSLDSPQEASKPRSSMATVLAVGVGVAAAAFFVRPSNFFPREKNSHLTHHNRVAQASSPFAAIEEAPTRSEKPSTKAVLKSR